jgi:geranylgeranyl pyrophosphate synthase
MLDYTAPSMILGKPTNADLSLGLATAPVLYAWSEYPELGPMIKRKFEFEGDVERVFSFSKTYLTLGPRIGFCIGWIGENEGIGL